MSILIKRYGISEEELEKFCFEFTEPCDKCFYNKKKNVTNISANTTCSCRLKTTRRMIKNEKN